MEDTMTIAIVGAGAAALGAAALAGQHGHHPRLWAPSLVSDAISGEVTIEASGSIVGRFPASAASSSADALKGADVVLIAVPGFAHRAVFDALAPHLRSGQTLIISSHASFGALYLSKMLAARHLSPTIIAWGTTVTTGRRTGSLKVAVASVRDKVDGAALPAAETAEGLALCARLFGDRFVARADLMAIALSNVNPQNHLAMALCNLTRIERAEDWGNYAGITPAVGRLMEALDGERLAIAAKLGLTVRTLAEHFHLSFQVPLGPVAESARIIDARGGAPLGPKSLDSRYVVEDIPYGIVVTSRLARLAGVAAPIHEAGVTLFSALCGKDFAAANELLPGIDFDALTLSDLQDRARDGWA